MLEPPKPSDEAERMQTLRSLQILDSAPEERFDRLTRLAKRLFDVPIALVSLVDENRQWFKSCVGLPVRETPRDISFCGHAILGNDTFVVEDTHDDDRFRDNPLVTGEPHIRFYAGRPLSAPNGHKLGTLCIISPEPRAFSPTDAELLDDLARMAEDEIRAISLATIDELTLLSNRRGFQVLSCQTLELCQRIERHACLLFFDLDRFKQINDTFGHAEGDRALQLFADTLKKTFRDADVLARISGDEFAVLVTESSPVNIQRVVERLQRNLEQTNTANPADYAIRFSVGSVIYDDHRHPSIDALMLEADQLMYRHKQHRPEAQRLAVR